MSMSIHSSPFLAPQANTLETTKPLSSTTTLSRADTIGEERSTAGSRLPVKHPFSDTDLILFQDNYPGPIPANGIYLKELAQLEHYWKLVPCIFRIQTKREAFQQSVMDALKTLFTRKEGRKLIEALILRFSAISKILNIYEDDHSHTQTNYLFLSLNNTDTVSINENGKLVRIPSPFFIVLGHELIHVLHYIRVLTSELIPLPQGYDIKQILTYQESLVINDASIHGSKRKNPTENGLRLAFNLPLRHSHAGVLNPNEPGYFTNICHVGLEDEIIDAINSGIDVHEPFEGVYPIQSAVEGGHLYIVKRLSQLGAFRPDLVKHAVISGNPEILKYLAEALKQPLEPSLIFEGLNALKKDLLPILVELEALNFNLFSADASGNSLMHHAARFSTGNAFKWLYDRGHSYLWKNALGITPLDIALNGGHPEYIDLSKIKASTFLAYALASENPTSVEYALSQPRVFNELNCTHALKLLAYGNSSLWVDKLPTLPNFHTRPGIAEALVIHLLERKELEFARQILEFKPAISEIGQAIIKVWLDP